jgi:spermidine/putrescine transport system substrate-binding protein
MSKRLLIGLTMLLAALALAACGDDVGGGNGGDVQTAEGGTPEGDLVISNWPGYIDKSGGSETAPGTSLDDFQKETGVTVDYKEDVNSNTTFFGKMQPLLDQGESGGRSMFVVTDWMAKQMYDLGYLEEINHDDVPTVFKNLAPQFASQDADPERKFTIPWQGGMTGIWVNTSDPDANQITSVNDLFDPKFKGKITMLDEMRDTVPLVMRGEGIQPGEATKQDWLDAIDKLGEAVDSGQIRRFTGNEYTEDLTSGNVVASIGWSGDGSLIGRDDVEWRMPDEGCNLWFDNIVIPVGAPNTAAALAFADFVYRPEEQAKISAWVQYITPVDGVKEVLAKESPKLAENPLIFPDEKFLAPCTSETEPPGSAEDVQDVTAAFQDVISG